MEDCTSVIAEIQAVSCGAPVFATSALRGDGMDELARLASPGKTIALVGKSGVGKSALVNALLGTQRQSTGSISAFVGKGMHTTTTRDLIPLPGGAILMDTPGMREFQLWGNEDILSAEFEEVEAIASQCRFTDCGHNGEPGCSVAEALADGRLDPGRWAGYQKMQRELKLLAMRKEERCRKPRLAVIHQVKPRDGGSRHRSFSGRKYDRHKDGVDREAEGM